MSQRRQAGNGIWTVLFLLAVLCGVGFWNFQRNLTAEDQVYRPFRTHTDEQIAQLRDAYGAQKDQDAARYESASGQRASARTQSHFDQQVREFQRVQQVGQVKKDLRARVADSTATLKLLDEEQRLRASEANRVKLFFKRLLTI